MSPLDCSSSRPIGDRAPFSTQTKVFAPFQNNSASFVVARLGRSTLVKRWTFSSNLEILVWLRSPSFSCSLTKTVRVCFQDRMKCGTRRALCLSQAP